MNIGELAHRAGVSVKAIRYYERIGLIVPERGENGYRRFGEGELRAAREIRELNELGIPPRSAAPFVECLETGHAHGDECVSSLAVYRDALAEIDRAVAALGARRAALQSRLDASAARGFDTSAARGFGTGPARGADTDIPHADYTVLPAGLPVPEDDGAAAHLTGLAMPRLTLPASDGDRVDLVGLGRGRTIVYCYPLTGRPGVDLPDGWDAIPGARGCSTEACGFRDHFAELRAAGAERVYGLSSQDTAYQAEVVDRLSLPFPMLSDESFALADALRLPTFEADGHPRLYARLTLVVRDGAVEHVFYPIFPPNEHAAQVLAWLEAHPVDAGADAS